MHGFPSTLGGDTICLWYLVDSILASRWSLFMIPGCYAVITRGPDGGAEGCDKEAVCSPEGLMAAAPC